MKRTFLLKNLSTDLDTDMKIILLDHQNNYIGNSRMMSDAAKNFDILATSLLYIIILIV